MADLARQQTVEFNSLVYDAAKKGCVDQLLCSLSSHPHLIDIPNPRKRKRTPLFAAAMKGHVSAIETLVELGSQAIDTPNELGLMPLAIAAWKGHMEVIETLVRLGSKAIDTPNELGYTPLHIAAGRGHVEVIEALVRLGSQALDTATSAGITPVHEGALWGHAQVIEALVRLGSKAIDTCDREDWTPLNAAVLNGHVAVIETLVRIGSKAIDTPNRLGTPLYVAVGHASNPVPHVVKVLKALGANANISTDDLLDYQRKLLVTTLCEEEVAEVRYRVYFGHSLTHQLLFELERLSRSLD